MLDGLSLLASAITVAAGVLETIKYARTLIRTSKELEDLQVYIHIWDFYHGCKFLLEMTDQSYV